MKKLVLGFIFLFLFGFLATAQTNVALVDIKNTEVILVFDKHTDDTFKDFFVFQYENLDTSLLGNNLTFQLVNFDDKTVRLKSGQQIFTFTIDENYQNQNENIFKGYGLSQRHGNYTLKHVSNPADISDLILLNQNTVTSRVKCDSGGVGSSECSTDGGTIGLGANCSVKCNKGYYSCCNDNVNECRCVPIKVKTITN